MSKLFAAVITFVFAFGLNAGIAQTLDPGGQKAPGDHKVMKKSCTSAGGATRDRCLEAAKATDEHSAIPCAKLTDRDQRECMLDAFVRQHDRLTGAGQTEKSQVAQPISLQAR